MGGEPLCKENEFLTLLVLKTVKEKFPDVEVYLWTGYYYDDLQLRNAHIDGILELTDYLIDGPYIESKRDITLQMRGSTNQSIINLKEKRNV
jgi:anaerobic ribonucleoside-triphosphate reductase activating protein